MVYKPTYITGGPHPVYVFSNVIVDLPMDSTDVPANLMMIDLSKSFLDVFFTLKQTIEN